MNPSLERKTVTAGGETLNVLDPRLKEDIQFMPYKPPPLNPDDKTAVEEWLDYTDFIKDDLDCLLRMTHEKFWCQAIFDTSLHGCIESYLSHAPRSHDVVYAFTGAVKERQQTLHKLFFMTLLRMSTHKESKKDHITPSIFGDIIYENFLFDIPKIMDICVLYGPANSQLVTKMIENIFTQQPNYLQDLQACVPTLLEMFRTIAAKCGFHIDPSASTGSPVKLAEGDKGKAPLVHLPLSEFQDVIFYLLDTCKTLEAFLDMYPSASSVFLRADGGGFATNLAYFYEGMVVAIDDALKKRNWEGSNLKNLLTQKLHQSQISLLKIFRQMVAECYIQKLLSSNKESDVHLFADSYIDIMSSVLSEKRFLAHLNQLYPFSDDHDILNQSKYTADEIRIQFIEDAIIEATDIYIPKSSGAAYLPITTQKDFEGEAYDVDINDTEGTCALEGACAPKLSGIELQSMISSVKDLLPDLGEGFIELCLEEFGYEIEKVIHAVLEDKLPASLQAIDRNMDRDVSAVAAEAVQMESLLDKRANVFDNDEFDAFRNKVDKSKVIVKKKEKAPKSLKELDDSKDVSHLRALYDRYGSEDVHSMYETGEVDYDDEYDDTYDSNVVGADDADSADELTSRRPFTFPRILAGYKNTQKDDDEDEVEDAGESETEARRRDAFLEDPAVIRQRQEERRASKAQREGRGGEFRPQKNYDVVGKAKGQGQDQETLKNRAWKEKNKALRVHHNRKNLADKKRKF